MHIKSAIHFAQILRSKLVSYGDSPYAAPFYLAPGRLERLVGFGVPYFYLSTLSCLEENPFHYEGRHHSGSLPQALDEVGKGSIKDLFFPPTTQR